MRPGRGGRLKKKIAGLLELPGDLVFDLPRITLIGNMELTVENHRGLMEYSTHRVVIGFGGGQMTVEGCDLVIRRIVKDEVTVTGRISSVGLEG
ncbi:MAG: sporulation protein YqfC [Firmicutes bacterium]|nr:sporulation protein YqfC [Bacillota bacterium]